MTATGSSEYVDDETGSPEVPPTIEPTPPAAKTPEPETLAYVAPPLIDQLNTHTGKVGVCYEVSTVTGKGKRLDKIDEDGGIFRILSGANSSDIEHWIRGALHMIG